MCIRDSTFDIVNRADGLYLSPLSDNNKPLLCVAAQPTSGWKFLASSSTGYFIIVCDANHAEINQTNPGLSYMLYNWGYNSNNDNAYRFNEDGCQFSFIATDTENASSTGISTLTMTPYSEHWYDLTGRRTPIRGKGVYVSNNGRKVVH